jgi:F-type H+-transporting ATPase subunit b
VFAVADSGGQLGEVARTFGVDWPHLAAQIISFSILCLLLYRLAYRPVLQMLAVRRQQIALGLANAAEIQAELAKTRAERQHVLDEAAAEAAQLLEHAREAAGRVHAAAAARAAADADHIVASARDQAARDRARMFVDLKREVGHLVVHTTSAVTGKLLNADDQRRLFEETERQLASS